MFVKRFFRLFPAVALLAVLCAAHPELATYTFPLEEKHRALSGTFGELRSNHFHSGIDLKTGGRSGAIVRAIQDGYVYRIYVSPYGYGNALYLRHADGNFSVYGHLSRFAPEVERYLRNKQYASKQFAQDLYLGQDEIPFSRGDLIAWSGNSGGSLGPHLHFEIRDPQERIMNPLWWYERHIADTRPPVLQQVALDPVDIDSRVNGLFEKAVFQPIGSNGQYRIDGIIEVNGRIGVEYEAYDLLNSAGNHCGINYASLYLDDLLVHEYALERYAFDEKRYINVHVDYAHYRDTRSKLQRAYVEPGNRFPANRPLVDQGFISLIDGDIHTFRLVLKDFHGNTTTVSGRIRRGQGTNFPATPRYYNQAKIEYEVRGNVLVIKAVKAHASYRGGLVIETIYGDKERIMPAYMDGEEMVFLIGLDRYRFPNLIQDDIGQWAQAFHFREELQPFQNNFVEFGDLQLFVPYRSMFERVPLEMEFYPGPAEALSDVYRIGSSNVPVFEPFLVGLRPPEDWSGGKLVVARKDGNEWEYMGASQGDRGEILGSSLEFGEFCLMEDARGPEITPVNFMHNGIFSANQDRIKLALEDDFSGVDHYTINGTLDGEWLLFEYDYRTGTITYQWERRPSAGWHTLEISIRDQAGNLSTNSYRVRF